MSKVGEYERLGDVEYEFGIAIPGRILAADAWTETRLRRLEGVLDWTTLFGRTAPVVLDLGCGNGRFLLASALARPDHDHLGVDVLPMAIRYARRRTNQRGLANVRVAVREAHEFLAQHVRPHSVAEIHLYHPQPYHDTADAASRLVTPRFLALVHRALVPEGLFVVQTDTRAYWEHMAGIAGAFFSFAEHSGSWPDAPDGRTRREIVARRQGLDIFRGLGRPRALSSEEADRLGATLPKPRFRSERAPGR